MDSKTEDDFWNSSSSFGFNFDDDEDSNEPFREFIFSSVTEDCTVLPIHSIISKNSLDLILDDSNSKSESLVPPVEKTLSKMLSGEKCSLEMYKKFHDKLLLLDLALDSMDGNVIVKVILFLKSSLKKNIFFLQLNKRKIVLKHYSNYLIVNNLFQELADLYMATGNDSNMKQLYYLIGKDITARDVLHRRLDHFRMENLQKLNSNDEKTELMENMQLLQWQIDRKEKSLSLIEQLAILSKKEWEKHKNSNEVILDFKKNFKIDDFAFEWTIMNVLASMELWPQLSSFFIKLNWLTKKNGFKSTITPETFVYGLHKHNPPKEILEEYISLCSAEKGLILAHKFKCHQFVVQYYINQRDRLALLEYRGKLSPKSQEYFLIENALQSSDKKWKN